MAIENSRTTRPNSMVLEYSSTRTMVLEYQVPGTMVTLRASTTTAHLPHDRQTDSRDTVNGLMAWSALKMQRGTRTGDKTATLPCNGDEPVRGKGKDPARNNSSTRTKIPRVGSLKCTCTHLKGTAPGTTSKGSTNKSAERQEEKHVNLSE
jgi:hypothetical protein